MFLLEDTINKERRNADRINKEMKYLTEKENKSSFYQVIAQLLLLCIFTNQNST
jgi:hypothetical protein